MDATKTYHHTTTIKDEAGTPQNFPKTTAKYATKCFAYIGDGRCAVLTVKKCECERCSFYKTREQYHKDRDKFKKAEEAFLEAHKNRDGGGETNDGAV